MKQYTLVSLFTDNIYILRCPISLVIYNVNNSVRPGKIRVFTLFITKEEYDSFKSEVSFNIFNIRSSRVIDLNNPTEINIRLKNLIQNTKNKRII